MSDLQLALGMWRRTRHEGFERVISALTPRASQRGGPPAGPPDQQPAAWIEVAQEQDPADVGWLLEHVVTSTADRSARRLDWLHSLGPHPLVGRASRRWVVAGHFRTRLTHPWWRLVRVTATWGSHEIDFEALAARIAQSPSESAQHLARHVSSWARVRIRSVELRPAESAALRRWDSLDDPPRRIVDAAGISEDAAEPTRAALAGLLAAVEADPEALAPREVLADYLLTRDDPRGRFLRLQLDRHDPSLVERPLLDDERAMLVEYGARWFGRTFVGMVDGYVERGFFVRAIVQHHAARLDALAPEPGIRTVRHLELPRRRVRSRRSLGRLLASGALANLRRVGELTPDDLELLRDVPARPRWVELAPGRALEGLAPRLDTLPDLVRLDLAAHPDESGLIGSVAVPELGIDLGHWLAREPGRTASPLPRHRWGHRLSVLLSKVHPAVRRVVFVGEREGLAVVRADGGWAVQLAPLAGDPPGPRDPTYLSLALFEALRLPVAPDPSPDVAFRLDVDLPLDDPPVALEGLPARPVFVDGYASRVRSRGLSTLPRLPELRLREGSDHLLRRADDARRFARVQLVRADDSLGPVLLRGDDGRLRYAWSARRIAPAELTRLSDVLGRTLEPVAQRPEA